jgi:hypothetical protein
MPVVKPPAATKKAAPKPAATQPARESDGGGIGRTILFAAIAAGVSYWGVTALFGGKPPAPATGVPSAVAPVPQPVVSSALAPAASKLKLTISEAPLPPSGDVPAGHGLLEIRVPDGTAIRVNGEYLGMGPGRRVPLAPGAHQLLLGSDVTQEVSIKPGQRLLVVAADDAPVPAGSP